MAIVDVTGMPGAVTCPYCGRQFTVPHRFEETSHRAVTERPEETDRECTPFITELNRRHSIAARRRHATRSPLATLMLGVAGVLVIAAAFGIFVWWTIPKTPRERDERWGDVIVYVDNATSMPCNIVVDGDARASVPARSAGWLKLFHGRRELSLHQGGKVVRHETRELTRRSSDQPVRKYLMVLGTANTYASYVVDYRSYNLQIPRLIMSKEEFDRVYSEMLTKLPQTVDLTEWNDVSKYDYVLVKPAKEILIESKSAWANATRTVLIHLAPSDDAFIEACRLKARSGKGDLEELQRFMEGLSGPAR